MDRKISELINGKVLKVVQTFQPRYQSGKCANHYLALLCRNLGSWIYIHQVELVLGSPSRLRVGELQKLPPRIFAYHLHKPLTDWLLCVNSYQPWTQLDKKIAKIKKSLFYIRSRWNVKWESNATLQYQVMMVQYWLGTSTMILKDSETEMCSFYGSAWDKRHS